MNGTQLHTTGNGGTVSRKDRKVARYIADALLISRECEALTAFRGKADDIALSYRFPAVIRAFSARQEALELSAKCRNKDEREILATAFDEVAGLHDNASKREFLQDVAAEIRNLGRGY